MPRTILRLAGLSLTLSMWASATQAQESQHALRFFGTGGPGGQDRIIFLIDDNIPGAAGNTALDVGASSFTFEWWMRGTLADNPTSSAGGDVQLSSIDWIHGNIILDRDIWCFSERKYGVSVAGGFVRFGVGPGDTGGFGATIEGDTPVLDDAWHHVAVVRDAPSGTLLIYVDGELDFVSTPGSATADVSYPDQGVPVDPDCDSGQLLPDGWWLTVAGEKHDLVWPSYAGYFDELRVWSSARSAAEIAADRFSVIPPATLGLVGSYRFEEGSGTTVADSSTATSPTGDLRAGVAGNGEWVSWASDPLNTAPIVGTGDVIFADGFESGDTTAWQ